MSGRAYDVVLFGATGFSGELTAEYLAANAPPGTRWAIAGRNLGKLETLRERLGGDVEILVADAGDAASLARVVASTKVVATAVGPYVRYGEPLVAACAAAGTDYVDLSGEPEFVDTMYLRHHETAVASGARLVHACGLDALPHDLGAQFCVEQLPEGLPLRVRGYFQMSGLVSGGTFDSALTAMSRGRQTLAAGHRRRTREGRPAGRAIRAEMRPAYERTLGVFAIPLPTIDPQIVLRSAAALDRYGPDFRYGHYAAVKNPLVVAGGILAVAGLFVASQVGPVRHRLVALQPPGSGPSLEQQEQGWFKVTFIGDGGGRHVVTTVSGRTGGYIETGKMFGESALCLAQDDLPQTAGQVTTAAAMGPALRERLARAGLAFDVVSSTG